MFTINPHRGASFFVLFFGCFSFGNTFQETILGVSVATFISNGVKNTFCFTFYRPKITLWTALSLTHSLKKDNNNDKHKDKDKDKDKETCEVSDNWEQQSQHSLSSKKQHWTSFAILATFILQCSFVSWSSRSKPGDHLGESGGTPKINWNQWSIKHIYDLPMRVNIIREREIIHGWHKRICKSWPICRRHRQEVDKCLGGTSPYHR